MEGKGKGKLMTLQHKYPLCKNCQERRNHKIKGHDIRKVFCRLRMKGISVALCTTLRKWIFEKSDS